MFWSAVHLHVYGPQLPLGLHKQLPRLLLVVE
jgi:hypothetical protein